LGARLTRREAIYLAGSSLVALGAGGVLAACQPAAQATPSGTAATAAPTAASTTTATESTLAKARRLGYITAAYTNASPFGFSDRPGNVTGADIETLRIILPKIGIKDQQFTIVPFASLIPGLQAGRFDLLALSVGILPARCEQVAFTEPTQCIGSGFAVLKGNPLGLHSYEDVAKNPNARLAVVTGGAEGSTAKAVGIPDNRVSAFEGQPQALAALKGGRADAVALTSMGVVGMLKSANDAALENALPFNDPIVGGKKAELCGGFAVRKDDKDFLSALNAEIARMKSDGTLKETYGKFDFRPEMIPGPEAEHTTANLCKA